MEEVGVETRGTYYDQSGALKDMVQNHLFQILSILAMEPLEAFTQEDLHEKQLTLLQQLRPVDQLNIQAVSYTHLDVYKRQAISKYCRN